jgi:hypothetical protein
MESYMIELATVRAWKERDLRLYTGSPSSTSVST